MGNAKQRASRLPLWLRVRAPTGETYRWIEQLIRSSRLHTVCEEARCPNSGECWNNRTATLLILGDTCTRNCRFCNVKTGRPVPIDPDEPERVATVIGPLIKVPVLIGLVYVVLWLRRVWFHADGGKYL